MKKALLYFLIATLSLLMFLIVLFPASLAWQYFGKDLLDKNTLPKKIPGAMVTHITGTLWNGSALIGDPDVLSSKLVWRLADISILKKQIAYHASLTGEGLRLTTNLETDGNNFSVSNLNGYVKGETITKLTQKFGIALDGEIQLESATLALENQIPVLLDGQINWTGGTLTYNTPGIGYSHEFVEMKGSLSMDKEVPQFTLYNGGSLMLLAQLNLNGWFSINVDREFFLKNQLNIGAETSENRTFVYEEKLW